MKRREFIGSTIGSVSSAACLSATPRTEIDYPCKRDAGTDTNLATREVALEPEIVIVDPHHHLWCIPSSRHEGPPTSDTVIGGMAAGLFPHHARYLLDEFLADVCTGHNVVATVYVEAGAMYRADGAASMRSLGEVEFASGIAAMAASGNFGDVKVCSGIVGNVNLMLGDAAQPILEAHIAAGARRYRGIRNSVAYDPNPKILGQGGKANLLLDPQFRRGFSCLHRLGLSFDVFLLEPQLPELMDLARAFPDTQIVLNHVGVPLGVAGYTREERFPLWRKNIQALSMLQNVLVKLGGLGSTPLPGFQSFLATPRASSERLATEWKPYIETCIDAFGVDRCMFESDFPPGSNSSSYVVVWNAFKRLAAGASQDEKNALFSGTATKAYGLQI